MNEKHKKDDSLEENINTMINDLLKEDELDRLSINNSSNIENNNNFKPASTPMICISTVPFSENSIKKPPIINKVLSLKQGNRPNVLNPNFKMQGAKEPPKKINTLNTQNTLSFKSNEFVPSPKLPKFQSVQNVNKNMNFNIPNIQVNNPTYQTNFYPYEKHNDKLINNPMNANNK
jgi:hypothetical protein